LKPKFTLFFLILEKTIKKNRPTAPGGAAGVREGSGQVSGGGRGFFPLVGSD